MITGAAGVGLSAYMVVMTNCHVSIYTFLKQRCLLTTWGTKCKVILITVVAIVTEMEEKIICWLILRQSLVTIATR